MCNVFAVDTTCESEPVLNNPQPISLVIDLTSSALSPHAQEQLHHALKSYHDDCASPEGPLGRTSAVKHYIQTTGPPLR